MIRPHDSLIVQTLARVFAPIIQLFALYVLIHGHHSPGGGFQAGTLFSASIILLALAFGIHHSAYALMEKRAILWGGVGMLIYAGIGLLPLLVGGEFLNYGELPLPGMEPPARRYWGILGIEIGITVAVAATAVSIFYSLRGAGGPS